MKNNNNENELKNVEEKENLNSKNTTKKSKKKFWYTVLLIILIPITALSVIVGFISTYYKFNNLFRPIEEKPIIYLYPEERTELTVKLGNPENITCSYPEYKEGWNVIANPDGSLIDTETGRNLYALYWEGKYTDTFDIKEGFVVKGEDTIEFLEEKLAILGLNEREAQEFIVYWLPRLQENEYNYIRFATMEEINEYMPLELSVTPDSIIRVLMQYKPLDEYIEIEEQKLETPTRKGFVVVEWGGAELK